MLSPTNWAHGGITFQVPNHWLFPGNNWLNCFLNYSLKTLCFLSGQQQCLFSLSRQSPSASQTTVTGWQTPWGCGAWQRTSWVKFGVPCPSSQELQDLLKKAYSTHNIHYSEIRLFWEKWMFQVKCAKGAIHGPGGLTEWAGRHI